MSGPTPASRAKDDGQNSRRSHQQNSRKTTEITPRSANRQQRQGRSVMVSYYYIGLLYNPYTILYYSITSSDADSNNTFEFWDRGLLDAG